MILKMMLLKKMSEVLLYTIVMVMLTITLIFKTNELLVNNYEDYLSTTRTSIIRIEGGGTIYELQPLSMEKYYLNKLPFINFHEYVTVDE